MIVQQVSNAERADNNESDIAEDFSNLINLNDFVTTLSVILSQSTH